MASETRPRWLGLGAAVWMQIASGNAYNFPLYSHSLKTVLGFNQKELTLLGVANDIGENVGIAAGWLCKWMQPWKVLLIGACLCFLGYGTVWLALSKTLNSIPHWGLWIFLCVGSNSSAWFSTTVLDTNLANFPHSRGIVAGILKGYSGVAAAVYTEIYSVLLNRSSRKLLQFLTFGIPPLCIMMMFLVRRCTPPPGDVVEERWYLGFIQVVSILLGIDVLAATTLDDWFSFNSLVSLFFLLIMLLLLMAPLAIPVMMSFYPLRGNQSDGSLSRKKDGNPDTTEPLLDPSSSATNPGSHSQCDLISEEGTCPVPTEVQGGRPGRNRDFTFLEALCTADFWLLFSVYFVGVGSGVTVLNNLAQIGIAQNIDNTKLLLSLFSFFNFLGRLGGGSISEYFLRSKGIPRTFWMAVTQVKMVLIYLLFALSPDHTPLVATSFLGVCYGFQFSIMVSTASELFGLTDFGIIFNLLSIGNPLGACIFSTLIAGSLYDNEAARQHSTTCVGPNCFKLTFFILAGVCVFGALLSVVLTKKITSFYRTLYEEGSAHQPESSNLQEE